MVSVSIVEMNLWGWPVSCVTCQTGSYSRFKGVHVVEASVQFYRWKALHRRSEWVGFPLTEDSNKLQRLSGKKLTYHFTMHPANLSFEHTLQPFIGYRLLGEDFDTPFVCRHLAMIGKRVEFGLLATLASVLVGRQKHRRKLSRRRETEICRVDAGRPCRQKGHMQFNIWVLR